MVTAYQLLHGTLGSHSEQGTLLSPVEHAQLCVGALWMFLTLSHLVS